MPMKLYCFTKKMLVCSVCSLKKDTDGTKDQKQGFCQGVLRKIT